MPTLEQYLARTRRWQAGVLLTVPLFAVYELGLALLTAGDVRNAADVLLKGLLGLEGRQGVLLLNAAVILLFLAASASRGARGGTFRLLPLVAVESAFYAVLIVPVTGLLLPLSAGAPPGGALDELVMSVGAGLYEEVLFRLVGVAGAYVVLLRGLGLDRIWAAVTALILSALLFSAYHHAGTFGEPWDAARFAFRFLAGVILGVLFLLRGFAVTCWTHALYDVFAALL